MPLNPINLEYIEGEQLIELGASGINIGKKSRSESLDYRAIRMEFEKLREIGGSVDELIFTECALGDELTETMASRGLLLYPSISEMEKIGELAKNVGIKIGGHASFLVNLASPNKKTRRASRGHLTALCKRIEAANGVYGVTHLGFLMGRGESEVKSIVINELKKLTDQFKVQLLLENSGKKSGVGSLEFIVEVANKTGFKICLDWAHLHAYTGGGIRSEYDVHKAVNYIEKNLGKFEEWIPVMHISGIKYGPGGELEHLGLQESDFNWYAVIKVLREIGIKGILICESPLRWSGDIELLRRALVGEEVEVFRKPIQRSIMDWLKMSKSK